MLTLRIYFQVLKLRKRLRERGLNAISVGQVHDFQGQEMKAIVISNVLARPHPHAGARKGSTGVHAVDGTEASAVGSSSVYSELGFLASPKRFNVAVTRAKVNTHSERSRQCHSSLVPQMSNYY